MECAKQGYRKTAVVLFLWIALSYPPNLELWRSHHKIQTISRLNAMDTARVHKTIFFIRFVPVHRAQEPILRKNK